MQYFIVVSSRGIWTFKYFLEAYDFCNESFFGKGDELYIQENF